MSPDIYEKYAIASEWQPNVEGYTPIGSGSPYQDQDQDQEHMEERVELITHTYGRF